MRAQVDELLNDLECDGCGRRLRGRSPGLPGVDPKRVWMSLGRWVTVLAQTVTGPRHNQKVVSHDKVLCWDCSPKAAPGVGMAPDSWRSTPLFGVVVAPKLKKRKSRAKKAA